MRILRHNVSTDCDDCGARDLCVGVRAVDSLVRDTAVLCPCCYSAAEDEGEERPSEHPPRSVVYGGPGRMARRAA